MQYVDWQNLWETMKKSNDIQFCLFQFWLLPSCLAFLLMWIFAKSRKIQKRCLRLVFDNYESDYGDLIKKNGTTTINNTNPWHMKNIFTPKQTQKYDHMISWLDIIMLTARILTIHTTYGDKSLTALQPKIWNKFHKNKKSLTSITKCKEYMRKRFGPSCKCNVCRMVRYFFSYVKRF